MPRGDGTGPFGKGPLNKGERGAGRGGARRRPAGSGTHCPRETEEGGGGFFSGRNQLKSSSLIQGTLVKALSLAVAALPALAKTLERLQGPDRKSLPESRNEDHPVIEVEAESVDDPEKPA